MCCRLPAITKPGTCAPRATTASVMCLRVPSTRRANPSPIGTSWRCWPKKYRSAPLPAGKGFIVMNEKAGLNQPLPPDEPYHAFTAQTVDKNPYETLTGRITFYCDHPPFVKLKSTVPTARLHAGANASNFPFVLYSPHARWGIHSNWRSNKFMMRLQRGEPNIYINPKLAEQRNIKDGDHVRLFNNTGEFYAQAKFYPSLPENTIMMEHGWEPYQYIQRKPMNNSMATFLQPLELVGGWGHLKFTLFQWNANQLTSDSSYDIEWVDSSIFYGNMPDESSDNA